MVAWQPDGVAAGIELRVNGTKTTGEFPIATEGAVALSLEAVTDGKTVLRAVHVVEVVPVKGTLAARFGSPRAEGGTSWKGVFIRAAEGAEVRAVADAAEQRLRRVCANLGGTAAQPT